MEYLKIGKIINTRGIKGELKVKSFTDFQSDYYKQDNKVYIYFENKYIEFTVIRYRKLNNIDLLVFKNFEDINLVEKYKGSDIFVYSDSEIILCEGEYHLSEIIGLKILQNKKLVGKVIDVKNYPQGDYLEIILESQKHVFVPFRDEFVNKVNLEEKYIEIIDMEGLL